MNSKRLVPKDFKSTQETEAIKLLKKSEEAISQLDPSKLIERRKYSESEFRRNFLPVMSGEAYSRLPPGYTPERLYEEATDFWMNIAGGPGYEVEVIEADGRTAFIVPAMMDTSIINTFQPKDKAGLRQLTSEYQSKLIGLPVAANNILKRGLTSHIATLFTSEPDQKSAIKKIDAIMDYYGVERVGAGKENKEQAKPVDQGYMGEMEF